MNTLISNAVSEETLNRLFAEGRNKILLALFESNNFINWIYEHDKESYITLISNLGKTDLYECLKNVINLYNIKNHFCNIGILGFRFYSKEYCVEGNGICKDGDFNSIRYTLTKTGKVYKMKSSKLFHKLTTEIPIPEVALHWEAEVFAEKRKALIAGQSKSYILKTGNTLEDFIKIYNCGNSFDSCMYGGEHASFYVDAVDCTAAWLEDLNGNIVARCIIFNKVWDNDGNIYRLAERQYSNKDFLKELLVLKLINENLIDGYKRIGAGASDATEFYFNNGSKIECDGLTISCNLYAGDVVSYQDSFKYYNPISRTARNCDYIINIGNTFKYLSQDCKFIKCPNCGKFFKFYNKFQRDGIYYCSEKCLIEGKKNFLDEGIQKIQRIDYFKYDPDIKRRIIVHNYNDFPDSYVFDNRYYIGNYTIIDDKKIPSEYVVQQFDLKGNFISEYANHIDASYKLGVNSNNILRCLRNEQKTAYKFIWKYKS